MSMGTEVRRVLLIGGLILLVTLAGGLLFSCAGSAEKRPRVFVQYTSDMVRVTVGHFADFVMCSMGECPGVSVPCHGSFSDLLNAWKRSSGWERFQIESLPLWRDSYEGFTDHWGREFHYIMDEESLMAYSLGPNGKDERGAGDDITYLWPWRPGGMRITRKNDKCRFKSYRPVD